MRTDRQSPNHYVSSLFNYIFVRYLHGTNIPNVPNDVLNTSCTAVVA